MNPVPAVVSAAHLLVSTLVPLNSSSNVQCHDPEGAGTGGAAPEHVPGSEAGVGEPPPAPEEPDGAGVPVAGVPDAPLVVEVVVPPPCGCGSDEPGEVIGLGVLDPPAAGAVVVVVVVVAGHRLSICINSLQAVSLL